MARVSSSVTRVACGPRYTINRMFVRKRGKLPDDTVVLEKLQFYPSFLLLFIQRRFLATFANLRLYR